MPAIVNGVTWLSTSVLVLAPVTVAVRVSQVLTSCSRSDVNSGFADFSTDAE